MRKLLSAIQGWLKRNKVEEGSGKEPDNRRGRDRIWYTQKGGGDHNQSKNKGPCCIFCEGKHWCDECTTCDTLTKRRQFLSKSACALIVVSPATVKTDVVEEGATNAKTTPHQPL